MVCLGDITDAKDQHNAELVNRLVNSFTLLRKVVPRIVILKGNHDFLRDDNMYFEFLQNFDGIEVITSPSEDKDVKGDPTMFLPYSKNPAKEWAGMDFSHYRYLFIHQTVKGSRTSNGQIMDGEELPPLNAGKVYGGDIHVPQIIGDVEYVGSPYPVHFGDDFTPRCVLIERDGTAVDLYFKTIKRLALTVDRSFTAADIARAKLRAGDQIKLRIKLDAVDRHDWRSIKREAAALAKDTGIELHGLEMVGDDVERLSALSRRMSGQKLHPATALQHFVDVEELGGDAYDAAMNVIETRKIK